MNIPPNPWDDPRDMHRHRGRHPMVVERGYPLDVEFLGWRSNTYELQHHGWEIAESIAPSYEGLGERWSIAIRHPEHGVSGMSQIIRTHQSYYRESNRMPVTVEMDIGLPYMMTTMEPIRYAPVDTTPYMMEVRRPQDLFHMPYFQPLGEGKEIFLKKASVEEIMQIALDKQAPEQAEIAARRRVEKNRAEYRRGGTTAAKLILVA